MFILLLYDQLWGGGRGAFKLIFIIAWVFDNVWGIQAAYYLLISVQKLCSSYVQNQLLLGVVKFQDYQFFQLL